jgi:PhzF family phenazine biosynthesis protein
LDAVAAGCEGEAMNVDVLRYAAFTDDPASGNPAGVVVGAGQLTGQDMLGIAAGVGYSETAFITKSDPQLRRYTVRYFSPRAEVPFCGHATIATAVEIARRTGPGELMLHTQAGEVPVHTAIKDGRPWATLTSILASSRPASQEEAGPALAALGWAPGDLDPRFPVHVAYAGNYHLMLAAATRARLANLDYDFDALAELMAAQDWTTVHLFWAQDAARFHARDPFPPGGVVEDPATGAPRPSAAICAPWAASPHSPGSMCGRAKTSAGPANCSSTSIPPTSGSR